MVVYLDACCYSRPFDNRAHLAQERVRLEITAIMDALEVCGVAGFPIVGSPITVLEINQIKNDEKRLRVMGFYTSAITEEVPLTEDVKMRAKTLADDGLHEFDAYHVAFAEIFGINYLLTTDDRLLNACQKMDLLVNVINPLSFMEEYQKWRQY